MKCQRTVKVNYRGKGIFLWLVFRSYFATWSNALCFQAFGLPTGEWVGEEERAGCMISSQVVWDVSKAQSEPKTKMLGKKTESKAQMNGFGQQKKIKEKVPEIF